MSPKRGEPWGKFCLKAFRLRDSYPFCKAVQRHSYPLLKAASRKTQGKDREHSFCSRGFVKGFLSFLLMRVFVSGIPILVSLSLRIGTNGLALF